MRADKRTGPGGDGAGQSPAGRRDNRQFTPYSHAKALSFTEVAAVLNGFPSVLYEHGSWPCRCRGSLVVRNDHHARCNRCDRVVTRTQADAWVMWSLGKRRQRRGAA